MFSPIDEHWMRHALALAARGQGAVEPNPMVGAVVLGEDGTLAGDGFHEQFGGPHAEVHAFAAAGERARGGTLYVTLEPCCHHGKTPPCTDAVLRSGVRRVVVAMADPFPRVAGGGLQILREAGIAVEVGLGELEARRLNAPYLKLLSTGKPWVIAKWAMTLDGKIATRIGDSKWISGEESRARVHELRGRVDAVVVGRGTLTADDPLLTARPPGKRVPTRVVVTQSGELPVPCRLRETARESPVMVVTAAENAGKLAAWSAAGAEVVGVPGGDSSSDRGLSPAAILAEMGQRRWTNILVEGGGGLLGSFLDAGEIDEVWAFAAPVLVGGTGPSPLGGLGFARLAEAVRLGDCEVVPCGGDVLIRGRVVRAGV